MITFDQRLDQIYVDLPKSHWSVEKYYHKCWHCALRSVQFRRGSLTLPSGSPSQVNYNKDIKGMSSARDKGDKGQAPWLVQLRVLRIFPQRKQVAEKPKCQAVISHLAGVYFNSIYIWPEWHIPFKHRGYKKWKGNINQDRLPLIKITKIIPAKWKVRSW